MKCFISQKGFLKFANTPLEYTLRLIGYVWVKTVLDIAGILSTPFTCYFIFN